MLAQFQLGLGQLCQIVGAILFAEGKTLLDATPHDDHVGVRRLPSESLGPHRPFSGEEATDAFEAPGSPEPT